jgi:hypothetical protein
MCKISFYHLHQPQELESNEGMSVVHCEGGIKRRRYRYGSYTPTSDSNEINYEFRPGQDM